jgi:hypothetical protein
MDIADRIDTSCSPEQPPNNNPTRSFVIESTLLTWHLLYPTPYPVGIKEFFNLVQTLNQETLGLEEEQWEAGKLINLAACRG